MTLQDAPQGTLPGTISLLLGHPDPSTLLSPELRNAVFDMLNSPQAVSSLQYGPEQGTYGLIEVLVEKVRREQGLPVQPANLMVVAGSTHAVDMLARLFARPNGVVMVEAPTYVDALHIFRDQQIELHAIPMDEQGLIPDALEKRLEQLRMNNVVPNLLYTIPNFHNPTGITLSEARRLEIIQLARRYGFLIVEDDVYRDLAFEGNVPASFYALAGGEQVVSIGSFSKTLAPGLRVGWILASEDIIARCVNCGTTQMGGGANPFTANIVAQYCSSNSWERHMEQLRSLYKTRRDVTLSALQRYMPADVRWTHPAGGFFIWLRLPEEAFASDVKRLALEQGVAVASGEGFFVNPADGKHHLRLAYSCAAPADIEAGIQILARVIDRARTIER